jgi:uncharacterized cupin superfamily protein
MSGMRRVSIADPDFAFDPDDPEGFRAGMFRLGALAGAERTGVTVYELPPGQAVCPYHYEHGEEEWVVVLSGRPVLRTPEGTETLEPWDAVCFPVGPEGAHQLRNDGAEPARILMFSEVRWPTATTYPDSGKVGVYTKADAGGVFRQADAVGYYEGET